MRPIPKHGTTARYNSPKHKCKCIRCTKAFAEYQRQRRASRPDVVEQNRIGVRKRQRENYNLMVQHKKDVPCADCGIVYPHYVMHFDHLGVEPKLFTVSQMRTKTKQVILDEIAKCEVVCANCHAERTHNRLNKTTKTIDSL